MKPYYEDGSGITIYHGDCREVLRAFAADRFATVITDPPYHLATNRHGKTGFMGKAWDGGEVAFLPETWAEVMRVCRPGAMLLAFGGTRTFHRLTCAIEDAGWEIRDCLSWLYGSGFPKSLDISKAIDKAAGAEREVLSEGKPVKRMIPGADQDRTGSWLKDNGRVFVPQETAPATADAELWKGWGTALKPAWEPIIVAMKPTEGTFAENAIAHGVAGINIEASRIPANGDNLDGGRTFLAWRKKEGRTDVPEFNKRELPSGRWPANVLLDEAAAEILDEQSGECKSGAAVSGNEPSQTGVNAYGVYGRVAFTPHNDSGGASRFFYTAKASRSDRGHGNDHPTVKPTDLIKYLCKLTDTPTHGEILDPFGGSMTTLVAAQEYGRPAVAIDIEASHCQIGVERLRQGVLFGSEVA